jgi:UPF0271 protein
MVLRHLTRKQEKRDSSVLVLDTTAILSGFSTHLMGARQFTTPSVLSELPRDMVDTATQLPLLNERSIEIVAPNSAYLQEIDDTIKIAGEKSISTTDRSLLALSLELKDKGHRPVLVSDDYALQNLAEILGITYLPYVERGIRKRYTWRLVCPACFREYVASSGLEICSVCGTRLKRKARSSRMAGRQ